MNRPTLKAGQKYPDARQVYRFENISSKGAAAPWIF